MYQAMPSVSMDSGVHCCVRVIVYLPFLNHSNACACMLQNESEFLVEVPLPRAVPMDCLSVAISSDSIAISVPGESSISSLLAGLVLTCIDPDL